MTGAKFHVRHFILTAPTTTAHTVGKLRYLAPNILTTGNITATMSDSTTNEPEAPRATYPLGRDITASARLHLQHHLWVSTLGYHLHPSIPLHPSPLIAEIGTGTGIFSLELARQNPQIRIEASDLSLAQTPPIGWWPSNVTFQELDIFAPIPDTLLGRYDVVCIRHFICVLLPSGDPKPLLRALLKLLKPGGYLQWQEWDLQSNTARVAKTGDIAPKLQAMNSSITGPNQLLTGTKWVREFHRTFENDDVDVGAELVTREKCWIAPEMYMIQQELNFIGVQEWAANHTARNPESGEGARIEKLGREAQEECLGMGRGCVIDQEMLTWVVRKK